MRAEAPGVNYDTPMAAADALLRGRAAFAAQAWHAAYDELTAAANVAPLEPEDLIRLGQAAELTGIDGGEILAQAHQLFLSRGDPASAARCAFWMAMRLLNMGERIRGGGWLARARRLVDDIAGECAEQGYLLTIDARQLAQAGEFARALAAYEQAQLIGERFGEADLIALAQLGLATCRVQNGSPRDGMACLDEVMIAVERHEVSPVVSGILYCAVINLCHEVFDLRRAQEWTEGLTRWCAAQPELVPFRGECQVHRAHVLQLHGAWPAAMDIAESVADGRASRSSPAAIGPALYQKAELHRLRGEFSRAEAAYRDASRLGYAPEPGLALMRVAQGQLETASASIVGALDEATARSARSRLLPAYVEIMLATTEVELARQAAAELSLLAADLDAPFLAAWAAYAAGAVALAEGDARASLGALRDACAKWLELDAPYEAARTRELIGLACRALGDTDRAQLELDAAAWAFRQLGAAADLARVEAHSRPAVARDTSGLTPREVQVLRLVAAGRSNRAIATELVLSEKTVARHMSNIFTKLGLSSRAAATAYAYEHALV